MAALRHGITAPGLDGAAALRRLCGRRPAGAGPLAGAALFGLPLLTWAVRTAAGAAARRALGRPDDFRGLSAMSQPRGTSPRPSTKRAYAREGTARHGRERDRRRQRRSLGRLRQPGANDPQLGGSGISLQPVFVARFSFGAGGLEIGRRPFRLACSAFAGQRRGRLAAWRRALLPQKPLARRIRVRRRLGRSL